RLGVQEAPSVIMSLFIGSTFKKVIAALEKKVNKHLPLDEYDKQDLKLNIHNQIPDILIANTDRNRTAPLAFTGKKLELRMVGASTNCALPVTILNTIVGNQLKAFKQQVDKLIKEKKENKDGAIWRVLRQYLAESEKIRHEGDKYSEEWTIEAEKLGLKNEKRSPYALDFFQDKFLNKVLVDNNIYSERELEAHYEVWQGIYRTKIDIEARTLEEMVQNQIIPIATQYQNQLLQGIQGALAVGISKKTMKSQIQLVETIVQHITALQEGLVEMQNRLIIANKHDHIADKARAYCDEVKPCFETIRQHADALELLVDDQLWTLPKYRELLYVR
ncbi:MAG: glutamine synthetase type III, partial [Chitinophagales bacterium]